MTLRNNLSYINSPFLFKNQIFRDQKYERSPDMKSKYVENNLNAPTDRIFNIHFLNDFGPFRFSLFGTIRIQTTDSPDFRSGPGIPDVLKAPAWTDLFQNLF